VPAHKKRLSNCLVGKPHNIYLEEDGGASLFSALSALAGELAGGEDWAAGSATLLDGADSRPAISTAVT